MQLRHLKRAKKSELQADGSALLEIILCPLHHEDSLSYEVEAMFPNTCHRLVCKERPRTRDEFKQWGCNWPIVFRPTEASDEQEKGLTSTELQCCMRYLERIASDICILVEPNSNQVPIPH